MQSKPPVIFNSLFKKVRKDEGKKIIKKKKKTGLSVLVAKTLGSTSRPQGHVSTQNIVALDAEIHIVVCLPMLSARKALETGG